MQLALLLCVPELVQVRKPADQCQVTWRLSSDEGQTSSPGTDGLLF